MYFNGAKAFEKEEEKVELREFKPKVEMIEEGDSVYLSLNLPEEFGESKSPIQTSASLIPPRIVSYAFENPDGSELVLDTDLLGQKQESMLKAGPISSLQSGKNKVKVW